MVFVTEGKDAATIKAFSEYLQAHKATPGQIRSVSIDMSPAFIAGVAAQLPNARITFDKFHVVAHASAAVDQMRRIEQRTDPSLKGLRWTLLRDRDHLSDEARAELDALIAEATTKRTARAWLYREHLREILDRKQINLVRAMLERFSLPSEEYQTISAVVSDAKKEGKIIPADVTQTNRYARYIPYWAGEC